MRKNKLGLLKILSTVFVLVWMITVFIFSGQDGIDTLNTSGAFIHSIDSKVSKNEDSPVISHNNNQADEKNTLKKKEYKYKYSNQVQKIVRKNAHYFLYMLGGILLSVFFYVNSNENRIKENTNETRITARKYHIFSKSIFYAMIIGILYACTDEFHQKFVPGRTYSIKDVFIDSLGIITGSIIFILLKYTITKRKDKMLKMEE